jgi:hypothetical protein
VPVNGAFIDVTTVTLVHGASATTVTFCGDLVGEFLLDAFMQVDFFSGTPCATIVDILIDDSMRAKRQGRLSSMGVQCALCHSTVDDSFSP